VFDTAGNPRGKGQEEYSRNSPVPGWSELDTVQWWNAVARTIKTAVERSGVSPDSIRAVGVSSETDGMVPVDDRGHTLRPYIHWSDARCLPQYDWILSHTDIDEIYNISGVPLHRSWWSPPALKMLWVRENEPETYAKAAKFLQIGNYVLYRLTGKYYTDYSIAARTMLFDVNKFEWSERLSTLLNIPLSTQPTLLKSAGIAGKVTDQAARETGLSTQTQVVSGGGDTECSSLGAGVVAEGQALVSIGTSLMVGVARGKPTFATGGPIRELHGTGMFTTCHVIDRVWLMENGSMGGTMLSWFKREFGHKEEEASRHQGLSAYDLLNIESSSSKPSENSPVFVHPNSAVFNLTSETRRADIIRGIQEGVAYQARQVIEATEEAGIEVKAITMVAGGAKSEVWRQIVADVTNKPVEAPDQPETGAYGAALLAGTGVGLFDSSKLPRPGKRFRNSPNVEMHAVYRLLYEKYKRMYDLTKTY
jgi:xylulokinase